MEHFIKDLHIKNFKSIKDVKMDCSRINLIVGKPNVGKSNILEALSLFCAPFSKNKKKFLSEFIRYNQVEELFFDSEIQNHISVKTNVGEAALFARSKKNNFQLIFSPRAELLQEHNIRSFDSTDLVELELPLYELTINGVLEFHYKNLKIDSIKKYLFTKPLFSDLNGGVLIPPFGENLFSSILTHRKLREEIGGWLQEYHLDLVLDKRTKSISVQKREGNVVYPISYNLIADTLQRIIFHYAAIESNKDATLLFEEPESHSFPPYIYELAHKIIADENNNQYFITTHSPYLFNTIIENTPQKEVSVFIANYNNYQTEIKQLNTAELSELLDDGIDIFFNQKYFING